MKDWLSPVLVVLHRTGITFTYKESGDIQAFHIYGARTALICAAAGIVMLAAAWLLYRKHHTERCGDTITVQWLRPVIKYGFIVCFAPLMAAILGSFGLYEAIGTVTGSSLPTILILLWISGICGYFIAEMLLQKTFRVFGKTHVLYCLIFNVVLTVPVLALGLDVFGYSKWVPETGEIERVILNRSTGSVSDPDAVEQIVAVHQGIADDRTMFRKRMMTVHVPDPEEWNYRYIDLTYQLKNGKVRSRHFVLRFQDDEMDSSLYRQIREMMGQPKVVYARYFPDHFEIARTEDVYVNHYLPESDGDDLPESDGDDQEVSDTVTTHFRVTREDRKKQIYDAVCADIESGALKIMDEYYSDKEAVYNVQIPYYFGGEQEPTRYTAVSIDVGEDSRETIKILNKLEKLYNR